MSALQVKHLNLPAAQIQPDLVIESDVRSRDVRDLHRARAFEILLRGVQLCAQPGEVLRLRIILFELVHSRLQALDLAWRAGDGLLRRFEHVFAHVVVSDDRRHLDEEAVAASVVAMMMSVYQEAHRPGGD